MIFQMYNVHDHKSITIDKNRFFIFPIQKEVFWYESEYKGKKARHAERTDLE